MRKTRRREFLLTTALSGIGLSLARAGMKNSQLFPADSGKRIGIIGLDTSHSTAFTKALFNAKESDGFNGFKVVAAYPKGSNDIASSVERIPGYTAEVQKMGVEIVNSIEELLPKVDFVLLETNDGRLHLEQALPVLKAGKRMFIDKPMTASLADAIAIFNAAKKYNVPIFSSSSLRYITGIDEVLSGKIGKVTGAEAYSPAKLEKTHPDLFWYGIHGVETLFTAMGTGCQSVTRISNDDTDLVVGTWNDGRIGTFRGIQKGKADYGGTAYGESGIKVLGPYAGYNPLLKEIIQFFQTGVVPVKEEETLEILAFMEAADISKSKGGKPVELAKVMEKARTKAAKIAI